MKKLIPLILCTFIASCYEEPKKDDFNTNNSEKTEQPTNSETTEPSGEDTTPETNPDTNPDTDPETNPDTNPETNPDTDPTEKVYKVTFVFGNGTSDLEKDYKPGETIVYPEDPVRTGFTFDGWDSDITTMPEQNITITAKWKNNKTTSTVKFDFNGGYFDYGGTKTEVSKTGTIGDPIPSLGGNTNNYKKEHHKFVRWEPTLTVFPEEDTTCYAQWQEDPKYTVTFVFNNGNNELVDSYYVGDTITYPANPTRSNYIFDGWDSDITTMPEQNITITAKWIPANQYKLTFNFNGNGQEDSEQLLIYGSTISKPTPNPRKNYTFVGWDSTLTTMPNENLTINAIWKYNVTPGAYELADLNSENPSPALSYEEACGSNFSIDSNGVLTRSNTGNLPSKVISSRKYFLVFPETVKSLGTKVFDNLYNVVGVDLRATQITSIPNETFTNNYASGTQSGPGSYSGQKTTHLQYAYLPNGVTSVSNTIISGTNPKFNLYFDNTDKSFVTTLNSNKQSGTTYYYLKKDGTYSSL